MLKIYNAIGQGGKVVLKRGIKFNNGRFDNGYGTIISGGYGKKADYILDDRKWFEKYILTLEQSDGFNRKDNFILYNTYSLEELETCRKEEEYSNSYQKDEEGILLFTDYVSVDFQKDSPKVKRILGRFPETGAYILLPTAEIKLSFPAYSDKSECEYEVIKSNSKPKQLYLIRTDREIER